MTAALVPLAAWLKSASVVTTMGVAEPPPVVPPLREAHPMGAGVAET
jgi:hypothetical protein